jgi:hypothetical protein
MAQYKRKKLLVNPKLQSMLLLRVVGYWLAYMVAIEFLTLTWRISTGPEQPTFAAYFTSYDWSAAGLRLLLASLLLVPIIWDMLHFSNRFAGPIFRMRRTLREVAQGEIVEEVRLRRGDFLHGFADDLNAALRHVEAQQIVPSGRPDQRPWAGGDEPNGISDSGILLDKYSAVR